MPVPRLTEPLLVKLPPKVYAGPAPSDHEPPELTVKSPVKVFPACEELAVPLIEVFPVTVNGAVALFAAKVHPVPMVRLPAICHEAVVLIYEREPPVLMAKLPPIFGKAAETNVPVPERFK